MIEKITKIIITGVLFMAILPTMAADNFDEQIIKGKQLIEEGVNKFDEKTLVVARSHFERLLHNEDLKWLVEYYIAYADYRLATYYMVSANSAALVKYLDDGIIQISACLEKHPKFADGYGLLSALLGQKIGTDPSLGMTLGMQAMTAVTDALAYGANNPRVAMFSAISAYYTPEQFGGSKTRAADEMARAVKLFDAENLEDKRLPDWGHSEALAWQAKFHLEKGELDLAQKSLNAALKINPQNGFAFSIQKELQKSPGGN